MTSEDADARFAGMTDEEVAHRLAPVSKRLAFILRHRPESVGITLDREGWVDVDVLLAALDRHGDPLDRATLDELVRTNPKRRFAFSTDGARIRASQGHSAAGVELAFTALPPPEVLYHGTVPDRLAAIRKEGLRPMNRHHVHLSADVATATTVGGRRGRPVVITVKAGWMAREGHAFFHSENGVWLVDAVPPRFLAFPDQQSAKRGRP